MDTTVFQYVIIAELAWALYLLMDIKSLLRVIAKQD